MASVVDICNLALSHLGDRANVSAIDPPEGSPEAEHCARFYPIARDNALEAHPWKFAVKRVQLSPLLADTWGWRFVYAVPTDAIRLLNILPPEKSPEHMDFEVETTKNGVQIVLTNQAHAVLRYTARVTDTASFSPLFVEAISWLLASYVSGLLIKGEAGAQMGVSCYKQFTYALSQAKISDANQRREHVPHIPRWVKAR